MDINIVTRNFKHRFLLRFKNKQSLCYTGQSHKQLSKNNTKTNTKLDSNKNGSSVNIQGSLINCCAAANCISLNEKPASIDYNTLKHLNAKS